MGVAPHALISCAIHSDFHFGIPLTCATLSLVLPPLVNSAAHFSIGINIKSSLCGVCGKRSFFAFVILLVPAGGNRAGIFLSACCFIPPPSVWQTTVVPHPSDCSPATLNSIDAMNRITDHTNEIPPRQINPNGFYETHTTPPNAPLWNAVQREPRTLKSHPSLRLILAFDFPSLSVMSIIACLGFNIRRNTPTCRIPCLNDKRVNLV
ncbi:MAG: hypothetical protein CM1200mP41_37390 [Gammaproteobacteria bacterium]|nr:MAG: hypothetical protein CM1200mP41_37390 [Gammaproteobacteria bacterium]